MKLRVEFDPDLKDLMRAEYLSGEKAVTAAISAAGAGIKEDWRRQIVGAALGPRLARAVRHAVYPKTEPSMNAATLVWSNAAKIVAAFEEGALIRSQNGLFLAIPTAAAGTKGQGGKRITPWGWEQRTGLKLRFVYRRGRPSLLVAEARLSGKSGLARASRSKTGRGVATVPIFVLVPQVKLPKRLDLVPVVERFAAGLPAAIVANWRD